MYVGRESKGSDASSSPAGGESVLGTGYSMNGIESVTSPGTGTATLAYLSVPGTGTAKDLLLRMCKLEQGWMLGKKLLLKDLEHLFHQEQNLDH